MERETRRARRMPGARGLRPPVAAAPKAGRREWIGLAVFALPCILYSMELTVLNLAGRRRSRSERSGATRLTAVRAVAGGAA
jgi:DHA2 family multidrug resistance protein-like MFS transporter